MSYVGKWKFHSIGVVNENDELVYMGGKEYIESPMPYIDETDFEAVEDEIKERKQMVGGQLQFVTMVNFICLRHFRKGHHRRKLLRLLKQVILNSMME